MNGVVHSMKSFSHQKIGTRFIVFDNLVKLFLFLGPICAFTSSSREDQTRLCSRFGFRRGKEYRFRVPRICSSSIVFCHSAAPTPVDLEKMMQQQQEQSRDRHPTNFEISRSSSWSVEVEILFPFVFLVFRCWFLKRKKFC
jgi:hypothetical protein